MIGVILLYVILFSLLAELARVDARIMSVRRRIVGIDLVYYRLQSISTCQQPPAAVPPGISPPPVADENAWWPKTINGNPGLGDAPPEND